LAIKEQNPKPVKENARPQTAVVILKKEDDNTLSSDKKD
jgi:hypothetical protein